MNETNMDIGRVTHVDINALVTVATYMLQLLSSRIPMGFNWLGVYNFTVTHTSTAQGWRHQTLERKLASCKISNYVK